VITSVVAVAVVAIALLTAGSTAVRAASRIWLRHWVDGRLAGASLAELFLDRPQALVIAAGSGVALAAFAAGAASARGPALVVAGRVAAIAVVISCSGSSCRARSHAAGRCASCPPCCRCSARPTSSPRRPGG
jgi:putative hemolysin